MVQFSFRLQSVLEYRRALADRLQIVLADRQRQLLDAEQRMSDLYGVIEQAACSLDELQDDVVDVSLSAHISIHMEQIEREIAAQSELIEQVRAELEQTREELLELERSARTLERLREQQHDEWALEELRREQAQLNELAAIFHQRIKGGS
jgi:flagellar protein FliJ